MDDDFLKFKEEILARAKNANACKEQYRRACKTETFGELMRVIKENFTFACNKKVIDFELIKTYKNQFDENKIFCNVNASEGFLLVSGNESAEASGNASVTASGNATVIASGNASVTAWDNATVIASVNASVMAWDNASVTASGNATVIASVNAKVTASCF